MNFICYREGGGVGGGGRVRFFFFFLGGGGEIKILFIFGGRGYDKIGLVSGVISMQFLVLS